MSDPAPSPAPAGPHASPPSAAGNPLETAWSGPAPGLPWFLRAIDLLVQRQSSIGTAGLPVCDEGWLRGRLAPFVSDCVQPLGDAVDASWRALLETSLDRLVQEPLRAPRLLMHGRYTPEDLRGSPDGTLHLAEGVALLQGPLVHDIASLLRGGAAAWEEDFVLDVAVRYWERARKVGLPVDADFGTFYKGVDWTGLLLQLARIGTQARQTAAGGPTPPGDPARLLWQAHATASRYIELKPLQRVLERISGTAPQSGYAFGRV